MLFAKSLFRSRNSLLNLSKSYADSACKPCPTTCGSSETPPTSSGGGGGGGEALVLGLYECNKELEITPQVDELDAKTDGKLRGYIAKLQGNLKIGKPYIVTDILPEFSAVAITSLGNPELKYETLEDLDVGRENVRVGVGSAVSALQARGVTRAVVNVPRHHDAAAEAATLAAWRFQYLKSPERREHDTGVGPYNLQLEAGKDLGNPDFKTLPPDWATGAVLGKCQNWARYLSDMPANKMTPIDFAQEVANVLCPLGCKVNAYDAAWIQQQRMECFLTVARGSCQEPLFLDIEYLGGGAGASMVLLAAKGVTFDCGGLCLKKPQWMLENRASMSGASAAVAAIRILAELKIPMNVTCCIPLCENMISGQCMKVGDVVRALNGLSIMIEDTDMEGKLLLADALVYGQHKHQPSLVIDLATCTHGIKLAMGGGAFGCFSNNAAAWQAMRESGARTGDRPWRMPLWDYYDRFISEDPSVDLKNRGTERGAPCIGAAFLKNFICTDWVHMDITGVSKLAHDCAPAYLHPERMTGRPTRTLATFLASISNASQKTEQPKVEAKKPICPGR